MLQLHWKTRKEGPEKKKTNKLNTIISKVDESNTSLFVQYWLWWNSTSYKTITFQYLLLIPQINSQKLWDIK
jgi:hypothetical protein